MKDKERYKEGGKPPQRVPEKETEKRRLKCGGSRTLSLGSNPRQIPRLSLPASSGYFFQPPSQTPQGHGTQNWPCPDSRVPSFPHPMSERRDVADGINPGRLRSRSWAGTQRFARQDREHQIPKSKGPCMMS